MKTPNYVIAVIFAASLSSVVRAQSPASEETVVLDPFVVDASGDRGYVAGNAISATRISTGINDLPFTITAFTPQFIADTGSVSLMDIVTQSAGVKSAVGSSTQGNGLFTIRGFVQSPQRDGFSSNPLTSNYVDASVIERVEVVKGPASLLYGAISPGGTVNYITKQPLEKAATDLSLFFGSYNYERTSLDVNQPLIPNQLLFRVVGTYENGEQYIQNTKARTFVVYPALKWIPTPRLSLSVSYQSFQERENPPGIFEANTDIRTPASIVSALYAPGHPASASLLSNKVGPDVNAGYQDSSDPGFIGPYPGVSKNFNLSDNSDTRENNLRTLSAELNVKFSDHWTARLHFTSDEDVTNYSETGTVLFGVAPPNSLVYSGGLWSVAPSWTAMTTAQQLAAGLAYAQAANTNLSLLQANQNGTPGPVLASRGPRFLESWMQGTTAQAETVGVYNLPVMTLQALGGIFYDRVRFNSRTTQNAGTATSPNFPNWDVDPSSPTYYVNPNEGSFTGNTLTVVNAATTAYNSDEAAYGLLNMSFLHNRLYFVGGARYNVSTSQNINHVSSAVSQGLRAHYTTPQFGLGYKLTPDTLLYASYSESYTLSSTPYLSVAGIVNGVPTAIPTTPTAPTIGKGYEAGVKTSLINNTLTGTVSVYQIEEDNVLQTLSGSLNGFSINTANQGAKQRGRGVEATLNWSVMNNWQVVLSGSEEDVRNTAEPVGLIYYLGQNVGFAAKTQVDFWTRYDLKRAWKGLWAGAGIGYTGRNAGDARDAAYYLPAYTLYNAALGYDFKVNKTPTSLVINFKNLGNATYKPTPNEAGEPRRILVTLTLHF